MKRNNPLIKLNYIFSSYKIHGLLITNLNNIRYLTGFTGSSAYVLITPETKYFLTDYRYKIQAKNQVKGIFKFIFYKKLIIDEIVNIVKHEKIKKLGIEEKDITYLFANDIIKKSKIKVISCSNVLSFLRNLKTIYEVDNIKRSLRCAEKSFDEIKQMIKPGVIEKDIAVELEYQMKKNGADSSAFPIIAASGKNSALPHASPALKKIKNNEFVIIDFGAKINGYNSDTTYTRNINNKNKILEKAYSVVEDCVKISIESIKIGDKSNLLDKKIDKYIRNNGFKNGLIHALGHGVGMDIHESPVLSRNKEDTFKEGMVFTIEPGIYLEDIGGVRLEIMVYLSKNGVEVLNKKFPFDPFK